MANDVDVVPRVYVVMASEASAHAIATMLQRADGGQLEVSVGTEPGPSGRSVLLVGDDLEINFAIELVRRVSAQGHGSLVIAQRPIDGKAARLLFAGASGFAYESDLSPGTLATAVRAVAQGSSALHPDAAAALLAEWRQSRSRGAARAPDLSEREEAVLQLIAQGTTTRMMARALGVSEKTVEAHRTRLYAKLGAKNQAHAISLAASAGLLAGAPTGAADPTDRDAFGT